LTIDNVEAADDLLSYGDKSEVTLKGLSALAKSSKTLAKAAPILEDAGEVTGFAGNVGAGLDVGLNIYLYNTGDIGTGRFIYRMTGTGASVASGIIFTPAAGVGVGMSFSTGEMSYDATTSWFDHFTQAINQLNNQWSSSRAPW
jgi:hypothetical protein